MILLVLDALIAFLAAGVHAAPSLFYLVDTLFLLISISGLLLLVWRYAIRPKIPGPGTAALQEGAAVVVTGCDCGFGWRIALDLHALGATVFAGVLSEESGAKLRAAAGKADAGAGSPPRMRTLVLDVSKDQDVAAAVKAIEASRMPLCAVVNNAAVSAFGFAESVPLSVMQRNLDVNFLGVVRMTKAFLPLLRAGAGKSGPGRLVNVGSVSAVMPSAFGSAYIPTKAAMMSYSNCVRQEVCRFGVKVCLVEPGFWATDLLANASQRGHSTCGQNGWTPEGYPDFDWKMARMAEPILLMERLNGDIGAVTACVTDAICSRWPLARYTTGYDARLFRHVLCYLPSWLVDAVQTLLG